MKSVFQIKNLSKTYGEGENAVLALQSVNLEIPKGKLTAIVGRSGSGKTTLLTLLGALDRPTDGSIFLEGEDIFLLSDDKLAAIRRRKIGFVFQSFHLLPEYSIRDNILMPLYLDNQVPEETYLKEICDTLDISDKLNKQPHELSGGQQQRVAIARALISHPSVILADEPTGNLDKENGEEVFSLLKLATEKLGQTVVFVTHNEALAKRADLLIEMSDGKNL